jgi:hypothetical protein
VSDGDLLRQGIEALELSARARNCLLYYGPGPNDRRKVRDLLALTARELMAIPNLGRVSVQSVRDALGKHGLYLNGEGPDQVRVVPPPPPTNAERLAAALSKLDAVDAKLDAILVMLDVLMKRGER